MGLEAYVRLSFNDKNPMQYIAVEEKRVTKLVMLQINLDVVSRPGVLFFDCNATRHDAIQATSPDVVKFDVVRAKDQFAVPTELKRFYQAEVLVPSPLPPELIVFPTDANYVKRTHAVPVTKAKKVPDVPAVHAIAIAAVRARDAPAVPVGQAKRVAAGVPLAPSLLCLYMPLLCQK